MHKKFFFIFIIALLSFESLKAQENEFFNPYLGSLDYGKSWRGTRAGDFYFGVRIGAAFSNVKSDDFQLEKGSSSVGLNVGIVSGVPLMREAPMFLELGVYYIEKGGKKKGEDKKIIYDINYIEVPIMLRYAMQFYKGASIQPMFGFYLAAGVSGKMKNFIDEESQNVFMEDYFKRFDAGLRVGIGIGYSFFSIDVTYDIGLANISHGIFDRSRNRNISLELGVNF